jgi:hypothetical protein
MGIRRRRLLVRAGLGLLAVAVVVQLVPYGRDHTNPPVTRDVEQGRDELNFSTWDSDDGEADDAADAVAEGSMPPRRYVLVHPDAALGEAERQVLVDALEAMDRSTAGSRP